MSTIEEAQQDLLGRARRALSPTVADEARVRHALDGALAAGAVGAGARTAAARGAPWASKLLVGCAIAGAAAGGGYWAGFRAGSRQARPSAPATAPLARSVSPPPPAEAPAPTLAVPAPAPSASRARPAPPRAAAAAAPAPAESLAEEVRALRAVERALRDRQPGLALALLRELDRAVPGGKLVEERDATRAVARCAAGDVPFGVDLGDDFAARYPASVYRARVEEACAAREPATDRARSGDSRAGGHDK